MAGKGATVNTWLEDVLAAYRLTRLATKDEITEPVRQRLRAMSYRATPPPVAVKLDTLLQCPWCAGFWIAAGVVTLRRFAPKAWTPAARVLATSAAVGIIATRAG